MARKYQKKNMDYWNNRSRVQDTIDAANASLPVAEDDFKPEFHGESLISFEKAVGSSRLRSSSGSRSSAKRNTITGDTVKDRFANIDEGILPWEESRDGVGIRDAIVLTQKAYHNFPVFKQTIDLLSEFTNTDLYFEKGTGSAKSRKFIESWWEKIKLHDLKDQFFREYWRSSNVFPYAIEATVKKESVQAFVETAAAAIRKKHIPIKYLMLNPADIQTGESIYFGDNAYVKVLTSFEIAKLADPKTKKEEELYNSLPEDVKDQIKRVNSGVNTQIINEEVLLPLDIHKLHPVFAKKQDYEPMAVPMGFGVLDDLNKKAELKKVDQAISRAVENVILLVTSGAEKDKGGVNHANLEALNEVFRNKSVGRVLVADYTTQAEFVIPDLKKVLGKEKYEVLNQDIREGLNNILLGESKYADTEIKLKIFLQRIEEARERFIKDFMQPEVDRLCKMFGFRQTPKIEFAKKDVMNYEELQRLITRMIELGIMTPKEGMDVIHQGKFPTSKELGQDQKKFVKEREDGYWSPLANGGNVGKDEESDVQMGGTNNGGGDPKKPTVSASSGGRPTGTAAPKEGAKANREARFSVDSIKKAYDIFEDFSERAFAKYKESLNIKRMTKEKKKVITEICGVILQGAEANEWDTLLEGGIKNPNTLMTLGVKPDVLDIAAEFDLSIDAAALLYHSEK